MQVRFISRRGRVPEQLSVFTGIIEEVGKVEALSLAGRGGRLKVAARKVTRGLEPGASIAVNGVCLTAISASSRGFACDLSSETLARTALRNLKPGSPVNLERPLAVGDRLGGHFVQGHIDGVGKVLARRRIGETLIITVSYPEELAPYLVYKGSVAIDGISLTVAGLGPGSFDVAIIPYTLQNTNIGWLKVGAQVNLECDVIGKYVRNFVEQLALPARRRL